MQNYVYDAKFSGNILIVGRKGCGKAYFTQTRAINRFFGQLKKVEWVSYIELKPKREAEIESCFSCDVEFHYPKGLEKFRDLLEDFKTRSSTAKATDTNSFDNDTVNSGLGEKGNRDQLIVMDEVPGLTDESKKLASFLKVVRKFNYTCFYIFHTIYPEKTIWRTILSQMNVLNIFPASVSLASVRKILQGVCIRKTRKYIPQSAFWISRLFIELANRNDSICLTLDCSGINKYCLGRF